MENQKKTLLYVEDLSVELSSEEKGLRRVGKVVDGVSLRINEGESLGLTGESASGKTTVAFSILRLIGNARTGRPDPLRTSSFLRRVINQRGRVGGKILFKDQDLLMLSEEEMRRIRGEEISMIFQNPISAMNPMEMIGYQVGEPVEAHEKIRREGIKEMVFEYLGKVDLAEARKRYRHDPHMFSGGEGQRIMIAMALICGPSLLIADEPTSSLDVTIQRQVLELLKNVKKEYNLSMLYITHDLAVIAEMSDCVAVMYAGKIVEYADVFTIFKGPAHPYTRGLLASTPRIDRKAKIEGIPGSPPDPFNLPKGCRFHPRCKYSKEICMKEEPEPMQIGPGHLVACLRTYDI